MVTYSMMSTIKKWRIPQGDRSTDPPIASPPWYPPPTRVRRRVWRVKPDPHVTDRIENNIVVDVVLPLQSVSDVTSFRECVRDDRWDVGRNYASRTRETVCFAAAVGDIIYVFTFYACAHVRKLYSIADAMKIQFSRERAAIIFGISYRTNPTL